MNTVNFAKVICGRCKRTTVHLFDNYKAECLNCYTTTSVKENGEL